MHCKVSGVSDHFAEGKPLTLPNQFGTATNLPLLDQFFGMIFVVNALSNCLVGLLPLFLNQSVTHLTFQLPLNNFLIPFSPPSIYFFHFDL